MGLFTDGFKELKKASEPLYKSPTGNNRNNGSI